MRLEDLYQVQVYVCTRIRAKQIIEDHRYDVKFAKIGKYHDPGQIIDVPNRTNQDCNWKANCQIDSIVQNGIFNLAFKFYFKTKDCLFSHVFIVSYRRHFWGNLHNS